MEYKRLPIKGYDGKYEIDTDGNIFSKIGTVYPTYKKLKARKQTAGYVQYWLRNGRANKQLLLHRLLYQTFVGDIPNGMTIDHIDGNHQNNSLDNLQLMTHSDNVKKMWVMRKARNGRSKKDEVIELLKKGYGRANIVEKIGCTHAYVSLIANGKR